MWGAIAALGVGALSYLGSQNNNSQNVDLAHEQMAFQERMSDTAYPRAVQGMKDAGLNPMLAYSQGGASTPQGALPQVTNSMAQGVASAGQAMGTITAAQQILQSKAQTEQIAAQTDKIRSETVSQSVNSAMADYQLQHLKSIPQMDIEDILAKRYSSMSASMAYRANMGQDELKRTGWGADVAKRKADAASAQLGLAKDAAESGFYQSGLGTASPYIHEILDLMKGITSAAGGAIGSAAGGVIGAKK